MQLARAVRNRTTGVLYVLDEPSIGLHPANIVGLNGVMHDLIADGNSVVLVDHDTQVLAECGLAHRDGPRGRCGRRARHCRGHAVARSGRKTRLPKSGRFWARQEELLRP